MSDPTPLALAASAARTTSDSGSAIDGEKAGRSANVELKVTAVSGTDPTLLVTLEQSDDGLVDWETWRAFPSVTGITKQRITRSPTKRFVRARWELGGTTPSFTFEVKGTLSSYLATREQLENRYSPVTVGRVCDDFDQGSSSNDAIEQILFDGSSKVRGRLGPLCDLSQLDVFSATEVVRLTLDVCGAYMALRHPEVMRKDGDAMMRQADADLKAVRLGQADLGTEEEPDVTDYGVVVSGPPRDNCW